MCPVCMRNWHHLARPIVQRIMHGYEDNSTRFQLIRQCAVCGHLLNIWINKKTRKVPDKLWYADELMPLEMFPAFPYITKSEREYWECAICSKKDNDDYVKLALTVPGSAEPDDSFEYK